VKGPFEQNIHWQQKLGIDWKSPRRNRAALLLRKRIVQSVEGLTNPHHHQRNLMKDEIRQVLSNPIEAASIKEVLGVDWGAKGGDFTACHVIKTLGPISESNFYCFRSMLATDKRECPYCHVTLELNTKIIGAYGVKWGHPSCVEKAFVERRLLPSQANCNRRPPELEGALLEPNWEGSKQKRDVKILVEPIAPTPNYFDYATRLMEMLKERATTRSLSSRELQREVLWGKSLIDQVPFKASCDFFEPRFIDAFQLPPRMKLNPRLRRELSSDGMDKAEKQIWDQFVEEHILTYRKTLREPPFCPQHQWSKDPNDHLKIHVISQYNLVGSIWWVCPAKK
jgi:hypothetical protein